MNQLVYVLADMNTICDSIPTQITNLTSMAYLIIKIAIPLLLIVFGMLDFGKAVIAGEEKEIKEKQKIFIKRLFAAVMVFLILSIVQLLLTIVVDAGEKDSIFGCISKILGTA